ncbi:hypothetical protein [Pantoea sp. Ap-967]|nr:hypothetical protein [Pantoea sp. Ap-967]
MNIATDAKYKLDTLIAKSSTTFHIYETKDPPQNLDEKGPYA